MRAGTGYIATEVDQVIGAMGRAVFFPQFAVFPIHYLDDDLTVFEVWAARACSALWSGLAWPGLACGHVAARASILFTLLFLWCCKPLRADAPSPPMHLLLRALKYSAAHTVHCTAACASSTGSRRALHSPSHSLRLTHTAVHAAVLQDLRPEDC